MSTPMDSSDWLEINQTFVPSPGISTNLTLVEVSPIRFAVSYPTNATGLKNGLTMLTTFVGFFPLCILAIVVSIYVPQIPFIVLFFLICAGVPFAASKLLVNQFKRPNGGLIDLERTLLRSKRGAFYRTSDTFHVVSDSRFEIEDMGGDESTCWTLQIAIAGQQKNIVNQNDLSIADLKWLKRNLNSWLGWEFPTHCVACGFQLDAGNVDWPRRGVRCSECGYQGPVPDPFPADAVPDPPPANCFSCQGPIWLTEVNRETGGCRCGHCGWTTVAAPVLRLEGHQHLREFLNTAMDRSIGLAFRYPEYLVPKEELFTEFPTVDSATAELREQNLINQYLGTSPTISYSRWRTSGLPIAMAVLVVLIAIPTIVLWTVLDVPAPRRTWEQFTKVFLCRSFALLATGALVGGIWGARKTVVLKFNPYALLWTVGRHERLIAWRTLNTIAVQRKGWPPLLLLKHGGTGLAIITPTRRAARALARLCFDYREHATATQNVGVTTNL